MWPLKHFLIKWRKVHIQISHSINLTLCLAKTPHHLSIKSGQQWLLPNPHPWQEPSVTKHPKASWAGKLPGAHIEALALSPDFVSMLAGM